MLNDEQLQQQVRERQRLVFKVARGTATEAERRRFRVLDVVIVDEQNRRTVKRRAEIAAGRI